MIRNLIGTYSSDRIIDIYNVYIIRNAKINNNHSLMLAYDVDTINTTNLYTKLHKHPFGTPFGAL